MTAPSPRRRAELARTAAAIKLGGASVKSATVDPAVGLRYGTVSTAPAGNPPTVGVKIDGSAVEVQLGVLRSCLPLAVSDTVLLAQLGADLVVVDAVSSVDPSWQPLSYGTSLATFGAPYLTPRCRTKNGSVELKGLLNVTGAIAANATLATLPAGYRPPGTAVMSLTIYNSPGYVAVRMFIDNAGLIKIDNALNSGGNFSLDGLSFSLTD